MASSGSGLFVVDDDDKRWRGIEEEIRDVFDASIKRSFPELEEEEDAVIDYSSEETPGDVHCQNVLTIWPMLQKSPELRQLYPHIKKPKDIGELIKKNLPSYATYMIDEEPSVEDVGFVTLSLSREWAAKSIHKMLYYGIDTWAPKLPVEKVMVDYPSLAEENHVGWFRRQAILHTLYCMVEFSKVYAEIPSARSVIQAYHDLHRILERWFAISKREADTRDVDTRDVVIDIKGKPPFILAQKDFQDSYKDLGTLRTYGIEEKKADWIVYVTPVRQQEYIEMCFTAAKLENWIKTDMEVKWDPSHRNEYPVSTYAGYRSCSIEPEDLVKLLERVKTSCKEVAEGEDAQMLGYTAEAVLDCVLTYTCLKNYRLADCPFNFDEMVKEEGNTFVYLLHRRAEIHRITNQSRKDINELKKASDLIWEKYEGWEEGEECTLEFHLLGFTEILEESCLSVLPHRMCKYLYDLSKKFESYNDSVRTGEGGSVAETSRFLLCEATALVMDKCFHLLGITPENSISAQPLLLRLQSSVKPPRAEREKEVETTLEYEFVHRSITPCFVSAVRDPLRKSRLEVFSIRPFITTDSMFEKGNMFGLISVSDRYGLRLDGGTHSFEPDFPYVPLFNVEWCDPVNIRQGQFVYLGNTSSHLSVPFSSSIEIRMELYVTTEKKDACFQLCNRKFRLDLKDIWGGKLYSKCGRHNVKGEDGRVVMHYILLKDAVDTALHVTFKGEHHHRKVYGYILADYGGEFSYDCLHATQDCYTALLFRSYFNVGQIPLNKSTLAVPRNASLKIRAHLVDVDSNEVILSGCYEFCRPTEGISKGILDGFDGTTCSLELKVVWIY